MSKRIILVGAGHAHLHTLKRSGAFLGHELVLVSPGPFWYSGLATGMLGGDYAPELDQVDVAALVARGGGRFVQDAVAKIDPSSRRLHLSGGGTLSYDVLSLNPGSETPPIEGEAERPARCFAVKPIHRMAALRRELTRRFAAGEMPRVLLAGGGVTAFEVAANILALAERHAARVSLDILAGGSELLRQLPRSAADHLERELTRRGARVLRGHRVARVGDATVTTEAGAALAYDLFVNATGLKPGSLAREAGLPVSADGAMIVDDHLRSIGDPSIHGGGDFIDLQGRALPKVGVYAIRQAPVLFRNLLAALNGAEPTAFVPQQRYLWIMNLGAKRGLAVRGRLWWQGRSAFWLKDWIDRRFLGSYSLRSHGTSTSGD